MQVKEITPVVQYVAAKAGVDRQQLADALGLARAQAVSNKYTRDSFSAQDLIKIAAACGYKLAFVKGDIVITFDSSDADPAQDKQQ